MPYREYKPRISVEISQQQDDALRQLIPPNLKSPMVRAMLDTLIHLLQSMPEARLKVITLIIAKEFDLAKATYEGAQENGRTPASIPTRNASCGN